MGKQIGGKETARVSAPMAQVKPEKFPNPFVRRDIIMCAKVRMCRRRTSKAKTTTGEESRVIGRTEKKESRV